MRLERGTTSTLRPRVDCGWLDRVGVRPNEGTIERLAFWVDASPACATAASSTRWSSAAWRSGRSRRARRAGQQWRSDVRRRVHAPWPPRHGRQFDALMPPIGGDGQGADSGRRVLGGDPPVGRQGPPRAGRALVGLDRDRRRPPRARPARARQPRQVVGPAPLGRRRRCGAGSRSTSTRTPTSAASSIGTPDGDLHRGWVWRDGEHSSIAEWKVTSELADDGVTHRKTFVTAPDKARPHPRAGSRRLPRRARAGRHPAVDDDRQRGPRPLDLRGPHRHRHQRVPPPARRRRPPGRPDHVT